MTKIQKINELARKLRIEDPKMKWPEAQKKAAKIVASETEVQKKVTRLHIGGRIRIVHI